MGCEFICDGCGQREPGFKTRNGFIKPLDWYQRSDKDGIQIACSRECIEKIARETGKPDTTSTTPD